MHPYGNKLGGDLTNLIGIENVKVMEDYEDAIHNDLVKKLTKLYD